MRRMRPLTPSRKEVVENLTKSFCATLPSEREILTIAKSFCATLPGEYSTTKIAKSFCATLPSKREVETQVRRVLRTRTHRNR